MATIISNIIRTFAKLKRRLMNEKRPFTRGDIITKSTSKGWFVIYDGTEVQVTQYTKKYALVLYYDPEKYTKNEDTGVYDRKPFLTYATSTMPCLETIDENKETYWYNIASEEEEAEVMEKLAEFHLHWNKETFTLTDTETGEVIKQLKMPKIAYCGTPIVPSSGFLASICAMVDKVNPKAVSTPVYANGYNREYWDDYEY